MKSVKVNYDNGNNGPVEVAHGSNKALALMSSEDVAKFCFGMNRQEVRMSKTKRALIDIYGDDWTNRLEEIAINREERMAHGQR